MRGDDGCTRGLAQPHMWCTKGLAVWVGEGGEGGGGAAAMEGKAWWLRRGKAERRRRGELQWQVEGGVAWEGGWWHGGHRVSN